MSRVKRKRRFLALAATVVCGLLLGARPIDSSFDQQNQPSKLLEQSYDLSKQLDVFGRTYALLTLLKNSQGIVENSRYEQWCDEMFQQSFGIADGWDRVSQEKNAVMHLSDVNPVRAMEVFKQIQDPQPQADGTFPEDVRAFAASSVFLNYWNSQNGLAARLNVLPAIEEQANRIGRTGEYPYKAMGQIVTELATDPTADSTAAIKPIFTTAFNFYRDTPDKFINRNEQFYELLKASELTLADHALFSTAVRKFVDRVRQSRKDMDDQVEVETSHGVVLTTINDNRTALLFKAFKIIEQAAPERVVELIQEYPELKYADKDVVVLEAGYLPEGIDPTDAQAMHSKMLQASIVKKITNIRGSDLEYAKVLAGRLTDDALKLEGYVALLPGMLNATPNDAQNAQQIYYGQRSRLQQLTDPDEHLRAVVALAKASYQLQLRDHSFSELVATALEEGSRSFEQDSRLRPQSSLSGRRGYQELTEIVRFGAERKLDSLPTQIQNIDNIELKASMLSVEAKALATSPIKQ